MLLKYFYDKTLAQASYMVGCATKGEAIVIDPARDIAPYLRAAEENLRITQVTETHIHADYVSGSRELAAHTGATIYLSDMGDADWKYSYADQPNVTLLHDGDQWMLGNIRLEAIHTPGHTPEHVAFMVTDTAGADRPMGVFSGDFLFVGDVGRPDLLEEAAGMVGTAESGGTRRQFESVQRFKELPDYLQIWPGHGAGSACGKALGAIPSTTLGYEKLFNPAFQFEQENDFVEWLLDGQPEAPRYFAQMKRVNKEGPALLAELPEPVHLTAADLDALGQGKAFIIDLRSAEAFNQAHLLGTFNVPATANDFTTYVGWFVDYEQPTYLIVPSPESASDLIRDLRAIGVDYIPGYFDSTVVNTVVNEVMIENAGTTLSAISATELAERMPRNGMTIIDVRGESEYQEEHIDGARNIPLGHLPHHLDEIPHDSTIVTQCASGYRSHIAASWLKAHGYDNIINLNDDMENWSKMLETRTE